MHPFPSSFLPPWAKYDNIILEAPSVTDASIEYENPKTAYDVAKRAEVIADQANASIKLLAKEVDEANSTVQQVQATINSQEIAIEVLTEKTQKIDDDGNATTVKTTNGYTFDSEGMKIYTGADEFNALHTATGTYYKDGETILSQVTKDGTKTKDIELYGIFKYGKETIDDEPMFISQMYEDEDGEIGFGHFYNGGEI